MHDSRRRWSTSYLIFALVSSLGLCAASAQEVGTIATLTGTVEIWRQNEWTAAAPGDAVQVGDTVRTGTPGKVHVLFRDDSVISLGSDTEVVVVEQTFEPDEPPFRTLLLLHRGKAKALVSLQYAAPNSRYQIETATAVASVRGTEFVIVFDPVADTTAVAGITGTVEVQGLVDRLRKGVLIGGREITTVERGKLPTPAAPLEEGVFRQYLDGLSFLSTPGQDGLSVGTGIALGENLDAGDRAAALPPPPAPAPVAGPVAAPQAASDELESRNAVTIDQPPAILEEVQEQIGDLGVRF